MVAKKANTSAKIIASNKFISSPQFHFISLTLFPNVQNLMTMLLTLF